MADVNSCSEKLTDSQEIAFAANNDEVSISDSSYVEKFEPEAKMVRKGDVEDDSEPSDLSCEVSAFNDIQDCKIDDRLQNKLVSLQGELVNLQEENTKLKNDLQAAKSKICKCHSNADVTTEKSSNDETPLITIKFHNQAVVDAYRNKLLTLLKDIKEFSPVVHNDFQINVIRNVGSDKTESDEPDRGEPEGLNRKRKRKKSRTKDLFILDTKPSLVTREQSQLKYVSKYTVQALDEAESDKQEAKIGGGVTVCFNCNKSHNLRDCPEPKDYTKINAARQKIKAQQIIKTRYHLEKDQKYAHLYPGKISKQLKEALGMRSDELPAYIYRMRRYGYPPGWMLDAKVVRSNMSLYDIEGKEDFNGKNKASSDGYIDIDKIVEYPGFNMPMEAGIKDDYKSHDCPPYSDRFSKDAMITYLKELSEKEKDNNEMCDMDLDHNSTDDSTVPPGCEDREDGDEDRRLSPTLVDLEQKKLELLAELDKGTNSTDSEERKDILIAPKSEKEIKETEERNDTTAPSANSSPTKVKLSVFGTPIIHSLSPYNKLPHPEKFSKDISPVINFENLPNATGKYEQMTVVLEKVRKTLKNVNEKS